MSPHSAQFQEALQALQFLTGYSGGWTPFERRREGTVKRFWRPSMAPGLPAVIQALETRYGDELVMGLPQLKRWHGGVGTTTVLWVWIEGRVQVELARLFKPHPTMVLQTGKSRRLLLWGLEQPVSYFEAMAANKRLSYALKAPQKPGNPDLLWIPLPGTRILEGRVKPAAVRVGRLTTDTFTVSRIVQGLVEPPVYDFRAA